MPLPADLPSDSCPPEIAGAGPADRLLLVEDNEDDVFQFRRLVNRTMPRLALDVVLDGETAIQWLSEKIGESAGATSAVPRAIFLDLRLPGISGVEVLKWVRQQRALDSTLVAMFSWSGDLRDIAQADRSRADVYLTKYPPADQFAMLLKVRDPRAIRWPAM
jgi:DNA-binding response OmpR family regulator